MYKIYFPPKHFMKVGYAKSRHSKILVQNETIIVMEFFIYSENELWNNIEYYLTVAKT